MIRLVFKVIFISIAALFPQFAQAENISADEWLEDIAFLDNKIRSTHPGPFTKISEREWAAGIEKLRNVAANKGDRQIATELMKQVALLRDGHTHLEPTDALGFNLWYPIRFYQFDDGLFITVAHREYSDLIGAKVMRIGTAKPGHALNSVSTVISADNEFQKNELAAAFLSSAPLLQELGITKSNSELVLDVELSNGEKQRVKIAATSSGFSPNYRFWGELFGPPHEDYDNYATPFEGAKPPMAYRTVNDKAPPYYAGRNPYWFRWDAEKRVLLFQFNFAAEIEESFDAFRNRMWDFADSVEIDRFVIDLRYNFGGDGSMMLPLIHDLIKRESITRPGKLYVLVGRQNFSAGVMALAHLRRHTRAVFIGEPAGAPFNHFGDPVSMTLPNSKMNLNVSTLFWQLGHPSDNGSFISIDIPVTPSAIDYFNETDTAYETATEGKTLKPLLDVFLDEGGEAGLKAYQERKSRYGDLPWWRDLDENTDTLNKGVNNLLAAGDVSSAKALLKTWAETQPDNDQPQQRLSEIDDLP